MPFVLTMKAAAAALPLLATAAAADHPASQAADHFGSCSGPIRNQLHCGSCWAFGAAETLSDNLCVAGKGAGALSAQDLVSCDGKNHGCHGGDLPDAWTYLAQTGIVSQECLPYSSGDGNVSSCPGGCLGGGTWQKHRCEQTTTGFTGERYNMLDDEASIKNWFGAAEAGMYVYDDFTSYKSGIDMNGASDFAIGGAFNCGDLSAAPPSPAGPATPMPAAACKDTGQRGAQPDTTGYCSNMKSSGWCEKGADLCLASCGCCSFDKPSFCPK
eukprot:gene21393-44730_t